MITRIIQAQSGLQMFVSTSFLLRFIDSTWSVWNRFAPFDVTAFIPRWLEGYQELSLHICPTRSMQD
jgi:hypothetical protein